MASACGEVELAVLEGAAGELAGLGQAAEAQLADRLQRRRRPRRARHAGAARPWSRRSRCWAPRTTRPGRGRSPRRSAGRGRCAPPCAAARAAPGRAPSGRARRRARSVRKISASVARGPLSRMTESAPGMRPRRRRRAERIDRRAFHQPRHGSALLAGRRPRGRGRRRRPGGPRQHLVGDLVVQRLGDQPALDQLGLGLERPRPDDGVGRTSPMPSRVIRSSRLALLSRSDWPPAVAARDCAEASVGCAKREEREHDQQGETFHLRPAYPHDLVPREDRAARPSAPSSASMLVRSISSAGTMISLRHGLAGEMAQHGAGGDGGDVEGAEVGAGQHGAALDVVDGAGQAVDAHHLALRPAVGQRLERAEGHEVVGGPHAVDARMLGQQPRPSPPRRRRAGR